MKFLRNLPTQTRRDAWVEVNLGAIEANAKRIRDAVPHEIDLMAIIKADAYGHGAVMVVPTLVASGVSMVGVAAMDEAIQIRKAGLDIPVLVIGAIPDWAAQVAAESDIQLTVFAENHLDSLRKVHELTGKPVKVHIKVDTGMHRIGIHWEQAASFTHRCQEMPFLKLEGVFSHLAAADDAEFTRIQQTRFQRVIDELEVLPRYIHLANSAGALYYPECRYNLVRMGIAFFGYTGHEAPTSIGTKPDSDGTPTDNLLSDLEPAMGLKGRIVHVHDVQPGDGISYGQTYVNEGAEPIRLATVPMGYADGIPRALSNRMEGLLSGQRIPQVGSITMDQMMFDVSTVSDADIGQTITLVGQDGGERITLSDWARELNTIEYELMCGLRVRLPKTYTRD